MLQAWFWWNNELQTTWDDPRQGAPHIMPTKLDRPSWWLPHTTLSVHPHTGKPRSPSPFEGLGVPRLTSDAEREAAEQQKTLCLQSDPEQDKVELSPTLKALKAADGALLEADSIDLADFLLNSTEPKPRRDKPALTLNLSLIGALQEHYDDAIVDNRLNTESAESTLRELEQKGAALKAELKAGEEQRRSSRRSSWPPSSSRRKRSRG